jgi:GxxExxY protein
MNTDKKNNKSKTIKRSVKTVANLRSIKKNWTQIHKDYQDSKHKKLTAAIISIFYKVYNILGYGFLEKVYENAMTYELKKAEIPATPQSPINVIYENEIMGEYYADILVDDRVIVEIKASKKIVPEHKAQLLNYLKATDKEVGLLLNFGPKPEISRKVFDNKNK